MCNLTEMEGQLIELYREWLKKVIKQGYFYNEDNRSFSNPYLCGIPDNWENSKIRLMICGREGNGEISKDQTGNPIQSPKVDASNDELDKYIKTLQDNNKGYVSGNRIAYWQDKNNKVVSGKWSFYEDNHAFARTFKKFIESINAPIIWNECDKICHIGNNGHKDTHALEREENKSLHTIGNKDILKEEIKILKPTHIIFLGYWRQSLLIDKKMNNKIENYNIFEFPSDIIGSKGKWDTGDELETKGFGSEEIKIYYFSHPQYKGKKYQELIDKVIENIKKQTSEFSVLDEKDYDENIEINHI